MAKNLIGNQWLDSFDGNVIKIINPATAELIDTVPESTKEDCDKAVIEAYAYVNNIQLDKVTMVSTVTKQTVNPNSESMAGIVEFKFTINDQPEQYTYRSSYLVDTAKYTNQVIDKNNNVVYTSTISD